MDSLGHAVAQLVEELRYKPEVGGFGSLSFRWDLFMDLNLPAALWPWEVDTASNRNEYQEYSVGVGRGVKVAGACGCPGLYFKGHTKLKKRN
jgi:hypothetical protein